MNKTASILLVFILFFSCNGTDRKNTAQQTDPASTIIVDGEKYISQLPAALTEISGLLIWDNLFWGFNDSGGDEKLLGFDREGVIQRTLKIKNSDNHDWESITQDDAFIYVGDFGNNRGNREDLCVYKIAKDLVGKGEESEVGAIRIDYNYASQDEFSFGLNSTPFDCEAMVEFNGNLYLFSKNWQTHTTQMYKLSTAEGNYQLAPIDSFNVNLLVTGADVNPGKNKLALIGYLDYKTYMWVFSDFEGDNFFGGKSTYFHLKNLDGAQTEGICFLNDETVLISCEDTKTVPQQVFRVDLKNVKNGTLSN